MNVSKAFPKRTGKGGSFPVRVSWRLAGDPRVSGVYVEPWDGESFHYSAWLSPDNGDGDVTPNYFQWLENNYACDCNRSLFFEDVPLEDVECGSDRYDILEIGPAEPEDAQ